jgi:predicted transcriptional regulator
MPRQTKHRLEDRDEGDAMNPNRMKLEALLRVFDISISDAAAVAGVSRSLVSKLASGDPKVDGAIVFQRLESRLSELVSKRRKSFFDVESIPTETVLTALSTIEGKPDKAA